MEPVHILGLDFETYSVLDVRIVGSSAYASHETTGVHCGVLALWRLGHTAEQPEELFRWRPGRDLPAWAVRHITSRGPLLAHNWTFEHEIIHRVLGPRFGWPRTTPRQWEDTAMLAAHFALPRALETLGLWVGAEVAKDMEGNELMLRHARVTRDKRTRAWIYPEVSPKDLDRIEQYCETDVRSMGTVLAKMPRPTDTEVRVMAVDREINARGFFVDQTFAAAMRQLADVRMRQLDREAFDLTGDLISLTGVPAIKRWLALQGVPVPTVEERKDGKTVTKETLDVVAVNGLLAKPDLPPIVARVLRLRQESGKITSLAKLDRVPAMVSSDGRIRFALLYGGAHTLRWSSKGFQAHNMAKTRFGEPKDAGASRAAAAREAAAAGDLGRLQDVWPNVLQALSMLTRSVVVAPPGREFLGGDFSAIEARGIAWLAGQDDVLDVFRSGRDIYVEDAAKVNSTDRQFGKVQRLSLGYGAGVLRLAEAGADDYGIQLPLKEWKRIHKTWRTANPRIVQFWKDLEDAAIHAVESGEETPVGEHLLMIPSKSCLRVQLPAGGFLHYWRPKVRVSEREIEIVDDEGIIETRKVTRKELVFLKAGGGGMVPESTYGGKLAENITQRVCRDVMAEALLRFADTCYPVTLHVHDSVLAEVAAGDGDLEEFCAIMAETPTWARGFPIAVEGYRSRHFQG